MLLQRSALTTQQIIEADPILCSTSDRAKVTHWMRQGLVHSRMFLMSSAIISQNLKQNHEG